MKCLWTCFDSMKKKKLDAMPRHLWISLIISASVLKVEGAGLRQKPTAGEDSDRPLFDTGGYLARSQSKNNADAINVFGVEVSRFPVRRLLSETTESSSATVATDTSKSVWQEIEEFYSDSNNMAMYCVLPLIILVYGGCSSIYCCWKCKRYLKRRKHKRLTNEDSNSVNGDERNDLNQKGDGAADDGQAVKTVSGGGNSWGDSGGVYPDSAYKKSPLPWDLPLVTPAPALGQLTRQDSFRDTAGTRDSSHSAGSSRDSTTLALEQERDKLDQRVLVQPSTNLHNNSDSKVVESGKSYAAATTITNNILPPPPPGQPRAAQAPPQNAASKAADFNRFQNARPVEIVPISRNEYLRHMHDQQGPDGGWDPLHNRPFGGGSRASSGSGGGGGGGGESADRPSGRETSWSIRDEIMAKYDALTSLAMAKQTAEILRNGSNLDTPADGHRPDTLKRKAGKKTKLIFIAE